MSTYLFNIIKYISQWSQIRDTTSFTVYLVKLPFKRYHLKSCLLKVNVVGATHFVSAHPWYSCDACPHNEANL